MYVHESISVLALIIDFLHKEIKTKTAQTPFTYYINFVAWDENNVKLWEVKAFFFSMFLIPFVWFGEIVVGFFLLL